MSETTGLRVGTGVLLPLFVSRIEGLAVDDPAHKGSSRNGVACEKHD